MMTMDNSLKSDRENDPYLLIERAADILWERSEEALVNQETNRISDATVAKLMTAAVKLYAAKADGEDRTFRPVLGEYDEVVTPTEALTAVTEVLRALRLGPMEFGLWSRRRPEDYHDTNFEDLPPRENAKPRE
ncbi:MAG: hypothetical protein CMM58_01795 [Rhodospirillaceae bacterium]|nr:hypothetical protein [Rhodospirillaceae bacterium]